jgi:hypothetical protein
MFGDALASPHGYFTRGVGLSAIRGQADMRTAEGIGLGSPLGRVRHRYAHLVGSAAYTTAPATDESSYFFTFKDKRVSAFGLTLTRDHCAAHWLPRP